AVIPKPRDLGLVFHPPLHTIVKNHVPSYTESTDYYPISEIRSREHRRYGVSQSRLYLLLGYFTCTSFSVQLKQYVEKQQSPV
ncbi:hypothetical protein, partial [Crocosphaera watsonii]|uniref:hypothetical protein n=1 Tax=Crocosphaera watsonii TaxID=263511 RepID=UPI000AF25E89